MALAETKKRDAAKTLLYLLEFGQEETHTGTLTDACYVQVTGKAAASSGFKVGVGYIQYNPGGDGALTLAEGDKFKKITMKKLGWAKDLTGSASRDKEDDSTQDDVERGVKSYYIAPISEKTGSMNGTLYVNEETQDILYNQFNLVISDNGAGTVTQLSPCADIVHLAKFTEGKAVGDTEILEYMPSYLDSLDCDGKPLTGRIPFNFNYTVSGEFFPCTYKRVVTA